MLTLSAKACRATSRGLQYRLLLQLRNPIKCNELTAALGLGLDNGTVMPRGL